MRVGIVGAGISGLATARALRKGGASVTVYERNAWIGGRCRTEQIGSFIFDSGASSIVPRGRAIESVILDELDTDGLVEIERPVYTHDGKRAFRGVGLPPTPRYCYQQGIQRLAELLAEGTDVRTGERITDVGNMKIKGEVFDRIVLAVSTPVAESMLATIDPQRKAHNTRYRDCLSLLFAFDVETDVPYHAVVAEESIHPLHWLSIESLKTPGRAPQGQTAMVVQMGPKYSRWNFDEADEKIVSDALVDVQRVLGPEFGAPTERRVVRWKNSQPDSVSGFDAVNPPGTKIVIASDGLEGGRIEHAYEAGLKAASHILAS